jgi:hypothetical protein
MFLQDGAFIHRDKYHPEVRLFEQRFRKVAHRPWPPLLRALHFLRKVELRQIFSIVPSSAKPSVVIYLTSLLCSMQFPKITTRWVIDG